MSIKKWKLLKAAARSFGQTIGFGWGEATFWRRMIVAGTCVMALATAASVAQGFLNGLRLVDFQWVPVKIFANGENPYNYSLENVKFMGWQVDANQVPSCLALLLPFSVFSRVAANGIWDVCNLLFTAAFCFAAYKLWFDRARAAIDDVWFLPLMMLMLMGTPWRVHIGNGQHLMFSLSFMTWAYWTAKQGRHWTAGILLALSAFKYTTVAPLAFIFLWRRYWKCIAVAAGIHVALTLGSGTWLGENPFGLVLQSMEVASNSLLACGDADLASVLKQFGASEAAVKQAAWVGYGAGALLCCMALGGKSDELLKLACLGVVANMMFYHRIYDFVTLMFPVFYVVSKGFAGRMDFVAGVVRVMAWATMGWVFFSKWLYVAGLAEEVGGVMTYIAVNFALHIVLLVALYAELYVKNCAGGEGGREVGREIYSD